MIAMVDNRPDMVFSGARMKRARLLAGLTRRQLAASIRVTEGTIWFWEAGRRRPSSPDLLMRLARALGLEMDELYERSWPNDK